MLLAIRVYLPIKSIKLKLETNIELGSQLKNIGITRKVVKQPIMKQSYEKED
jgi:hypothetical protein